MTSFEEAHKKFGDYLKRKGRANATLLAYLKDIEQLNKHFMESGKNLFHEVEKQDIENFLKSLKDSGYTTKSISRKINSIRTFFGFLLEERVIEANPAKFITHPKLKPKDPRILSKIEYRALRDTVKDDPRTRAVFEIFLQTGIRISELAAIKIDDLEFKENGKESNLYIRSDKAHVSRTIPLNESGEKSIKGYINVRPKVRAKAFFVTKTGKPLLIRNIRATMDRYFKKAGLENIKVNDLRHTFIAHHLKEGASLYYISKIAGHKRISTTEKYLEFIDRKDKVEKMELGEL